MTPGTVAQLDERRCLRLPTGASVGRLVHSVGALPAVLPFRYRPLLTAARSWAPVPTVRSSGRCPGRWSHFEAGEVAESDGGGWSVTVLGRAEVDAVAPGTGQVSVRIGPELLRGRFLPAAPTGPSGREGRPPPL